jgi:hypothetical protein
MAAMQHRSQNIPLAHFYWRTGLLLLFLFLWVVSALARMTNDLPTGVPNPIGPDGKYTHAMEFTTKAYEKEAFRFLLIEANKVAGELHLAERLPIQETNVVDAFIAPFGDAYATGGIGCISTSNYFYSVADNSQCGIITRTHYDEAMHYYESHCFLPQSEINTNEAYEMATQWLRSWSVDVDALNHDLHLVLKHNPGRGSAPSGKFVPVYAVAWCKPWKPLPGLIQEHHGDWAPVVTVLLFAPTKTLLELEIRDPKYNHRAPIVFTNLAELLTGTNSTALTNASPNPYSPEQPALPLADPHRGLSIKEK